jgi:hypothetical protein
MSIMVLIVKKQSHKRCDLILVPKRILNDFLDKHVARQHLNAHNPNTCMVNSDDKWIGKPSHSEVMKLLLDTLQKQRILEGV